MVSRKWLAVAVAVMALAMSAQAAAPKVTQGSLEIVDRDGRPQAFCPLKHTGVKGEISGFLARISVKQEFQNPSNERIEAIYVFPLPQNAAVDDMTVHVGGRTIKGLIKKRAEARQIYEQARQQGHLAALLDQERPNIFTQSVANIAPGENVTVEISYIETLKYEDGGYEFVFPMVVGPRYIPGQPIGKQGGGWAPDTTQVPDASRITPPVAPKGTRAGHDISLELALDAGVSVEEVRSNTHVIDFAREGTRGGQIKLRDQAEIPNKDFILRYKVAGGHIEDAILATTAFAQIGRETRGGGVAGNTAGYFTLILQPPDRPTAAQITPKEIVFVLDTSGSMMGFPIEKAKQAMNLAIGALNPNDTFNLITFAGDTRILFPEPVAATPANLQMAQQFLAGQRGGGGTEMMKAIRAALDPSDEKDHIRVVCFMTDGYVGNDMEIIGEVQRHPNARVFAFGIGSSVNRFLLDKMAEAGRGEVEYVGLNDDGDKAARRFHERVHTPVLTDISVDWNGIPVADVTPFRIPDLFSAKPVILSGRYTAPANGTIRLRGLIAGQPFTREIRVNFPASESDHDVVAKLWARRRVDDIMSRDWQGMQSGQPRKEVEEEITQLGLSFRMMTQFTSFVAVEERKVNDGNGAPRTIQVPVEMPEGVSHEGVFGTAGEQAVNVASPMAAPMVMRKSQGYGGIISGRIDAAAQAPVPREQRGMGQGTSGGIGSVAMDKDEAEMRTGSKVAPALIQLYVCWKKQGDAGNCGVIQAGIVSVQVQLASVSDATLKKLQALGFKADAAPQGALYLSGTVHIDKLSDLARLAEVQYIGVAPARVRGVR